MHISWFRTLNSLGAGIGAELQSNVGDKGESLAHNRIVPLKEAEAMRFGADIHGEHRTEVPAQLDYTVNIS